MPVLTYAAALNEALAASMRRDPRVVLLGEDVGAYGGIFQVSKGLAAEFGADRVVDTPISEAGFVGAAVGAALAGMRPVVEVMFIDFTTVCMDMIVNQAAKMRYMFGGRGRVPMVLRTCFGAGKSAAAQHSQSLYAFFMHVPGLLVVCPATPHDAKGLLLEAIADDNPVIFLEHKKLYGMRGEVPEEEYRIPFGRAVVRRSGADLTVFAAGAMLHQALKAAEILTKEGIEAEIIDPRTLVPLDTECLFTSVRKTGRLVVVDEGHACCGLSAEIAALCAEHCTAYLKAPIVRVAAPPAPVPFSPPLEQAFVPDVRKILSAARIAASY